MGRPVSPPRLPASALPPRCGTDVMLHVIRRMLVELRWLYNNFLSGRGRLDWLDGPYQRITVRDGGFDVGCAPYPGEGEEDRLDRQRLLEGGIRTAFFAQVRRKGPVFYVEYENANKALCSDPGGTLCEGDVLNAISDFGQHKRAIDFLKVAEEARGGLLALPVKALLGGVENEAVLKGVRRPPPRGLADDVQLNPEQQLAVEERSARLVLPIFGPPGTGKTTVITALLKAPVCDGRRLLLAASRHMVIVCSEKNLAVDAVADKLIRAGGGEPESSLWRETITHGVEANIGDSSARFLIDHKVLESTEVKNAVAQRQGAQAIVELKRKGLVKAVKKHVPTIAVACSKDVVSDLDVEKKGKRARPKIRLSEALLRGWEAERLAEAALSCESHMEAGDSEVAIALAVIRNAYEKLRLAKHSVERCDTKLIREKKQAKLRLQAEARVVLVTLGSAHGVSRTLNVDLEDSSVPMSFTVICDESSTVHSALFVSAMDCLQSRITNLVIVGDDRQLDPYWPYGDFRDTVEPVALFHDALIVARDQAVHLRAQYRMPREIMSFVNELFYSDCPLRFGKGEDAPESIRPLQWVHVPSGIALSAKDRRVARDRPESSRAEAAVAGDIARSAREKGLSVLVITPYRKQRDLLERELGVGGGAKKARGNSEPLVLSSSDGGLTICTVDGAQGKESDVVIISMVRQRPSRFLHNKRMCVMFSRAKAQMIVIGDHETHVSCNTLPLRTLAEVSRLCSGVE